MRRGRIWLWGAGIVLIGAAAGLALFRPPFHGELLRIHVVANSDDPEDQRLKRQVRDAVLRELDTLRPEATDASEYLAVLQAQLPALERAANMALAEGGSGETALCKAGVYRFTTRSMGEETLPAGRYPALVVEIGAAAGENWWCVMYPPWFLWEEEPAALPEGWESGSADELFTRDVALRS